MDKREREILRNEKQYVALSIRTHTQGNSSFALLDCQQVGERMGKHLEETESARHRRRLRNSRAVSLAAELDV